VHFVFLCEKEVGRFLRCTQCPHIPGQRIILHQTGKEMCTDHLCALRTVSVNVQAIAKHSRFASVVHNPLVKFRQLLDMFSVDALRQGIKEQRPAGQVIGAPVCVTGAKLRTLQIHHHEIHAAQRIMIQPGFCQFQTEFQLGIKKQRFGKC